VQIGLGNSEQLTLACKLTQTFSIFPAGKIERSYPEIFRIDTLTFTFYKFDSNLRHHIRTTNHLERLFREFRTKSDEIGAFPNKTSCLTIFWLVVERDRAKHDRKAPANNS
jgi:transposase-like protein